MNGLGVARAGPNLDGVKGCQTPEIVGTAEAGYLATPEVRENSKWPRRTSGLAAPPFALLNLNPMTMWVLNVVPIAKVSLNLNHHVGRGQG